MPGLKQLTRGDIPVISIRKKRHIIWPVIHLRKFTFESYQALLDRVRNEGVSLMFENVYEHHPDEILILFETLGKERVGFCLGTVHQAVFSNAFISH